MKLSGFTVIAVAWLLSTALARDQCEDVLQARLDCYDTDGPCDPLPIPDSVFGRQPDPSKGYFIDTLRDGMYTVSEGVYWFLVVVAEGLPTADNDRALRGLKTGKTNGHNTVAVFDFPEGSFVVRDASTGQVTGSRITDALEEIVQMHSLEPQDIDLVQMVYSHNHFDHVGAATIVHDYISDNWSPDVIDIIAHEEVKHDYETRTEADFFSFRAPLPTTVVNEPTRFQVGNSDLHFTLTPTRGHTDDKDLVIFFEADGDDPAVMMFVDVIFPGWAPFFNFAVTTDVFAFLHVHELLLEEFDLGDDGIFVGGHLTKLGNKMDIEMSYNYTKAVLEGAQEALGTVDFNAVFAASGVGDPTSNKLGNTWYLFGLYLREMVKLCAKKVVEEFGCVLAGVDVTTDSACQSALNFLRLDF